MLSARPPPVREKPCAENESEYYERGDRLKQSQYSSYDELPLFFNAETVAAVLGIAPSSAYELMHEKEFPTLRIGNRIVVPKEKFIEWVQKRTEGERG